MSFDYHMKYLKIYENDYFVKNNYFKIISIILR